MFFQKQLDVFSAFLYSRYRIYNIVIMRILHFFILSAIFLFSVSCRPKNKASAEVAVADLEVVEPEIALPDKPEVSKEDTTIYQAPPTTARLENAVDYFRRNNRLKDWDPSKAKELLLKAVIEKDGSPARIRVMMYKEKDASTKEMKIIKDWKEDDFTHEAVRLIEEAEISPALNEQKNPVRSEWWNVIPFPPL
jgi:hypothetical protein